ncbi:MAG: hypothetical protein IH984_05400 [Planctomycetes bacterium]|nr:hypothetical protein [Planctomycetota bacterium]
MHVLTKIFIVLVSMLSVLLVPLVVAYAHNEANYKDKYAQADLKEATSAKRLHEEQISSAAAKSRMDLALQAAIDDNSDLSDDLKQSQADVRKLESQLIRNETLQASIEARLAVLASSVQASQKLTDNLVGELRTIRNDAAADAKRVIDLDERLRDVDAQLEVAVSARRALQEELSQLRSELATAVRDVSSYEQKFGTLITKGEIPPPPLSDLDATVVNVRRGQDQTLAVINAGSRDGIEKGWVMNVARGGSFIATLRIIEVDINRSTGILELQDIPNRGEVQPGDRVMTRSGNG